MADDRIVGRVDALIQTRPHLASLREDFIRRAGDLLVAEAGQGNWLVARRSDPGTPILPPADWGTRAATFRWPVIELRTAFLVLGVPGPPMWSALLNRRSPEGFQPPIDLIEPDADALVAWLMTIEEIKALRDERIGTYTGTEAMERYRAALHSEASRMLPSQVLCHPRPEYDAAIPDASWFAPIVQARQARHVTLASQQAARYAECDPSDRRQRFAAAAGGEHTLRAVGMTTRHSTVIQHAMRDLADAFHHRGWPFDIVCETHPYTSIVDPWGLLAKEDVDLAFVINHLRREMQGYVCENVPYVAWIQDAMPGLLSREAGASVGPLDVIVCHSPGVMEHAYGYPGGNLIEASNLTNPRVFDVASLPDAELEPHRCDVSYVGHGAETPEQMVAELKARGGAALGAFAQRFLELATTLLEVRGAMTQLDVLSLMWRAEQESGHPPIPRQVRRSHVHPQMMRLYDRLFRHQALRWAADWADANDRRLRIFGHGWESHPRLAQFACGSVEHGRSLRAVFQASTINLQLNAYASLHQRLLDALACGGFVLCRYNPTDFIRAPFAHVSEAIERERVDCLDELLRAASHEAALAESIDSIERLAGVFIRRADDPARVEELRVRAATMNRPPESLTDEALLDELCSLRLVPRRAAGDLPRFDETTFDSRTAMHELLDRFAEDVAARHAISADMRRSVIANDTFDVLVDRIIERLSGVEAHSMQGMEAAHA